MHDRRVEEPRISDTADAFAKLGDSTRLAILNALGDPEAPGTPREATFSELRGRVDAGSARFNYHLNALRERFVEERDGAYRLTTPGLIAYTLFREAVFDRDTDVAPFPTTTTCREADCPGDLHATYHDGSLELACDACDVLLYRRPVPPKTVADTTRQGLLDAFTARLHREFGTRYRGRCPACLAHLTPRLVDGAPDHERARDLDVHLVHDCDACDIFAFATVGERLLAAPAVRGFAYDVGVELATERPWRYAWAASDQQTTIRSRDPWLVAVDVSVAGETATFVLDDDLAVARD